MPRVLILGAGGHAQVVADILFRAEEVGGDCQPMGFLDNNPSIAGTVIMGLPVLGEIGQLSEFEHDAVVIAMGDNIVRASVFDSAQEGGERFVNAVHPDAVLAPDVRLGEGVVICARVAVNTGTEIGDNVILNTGCTVDHHTRIGAHAHVAPGGHLAGDVSVGEGALIGIGSAIIPDRSVGDWAVVGAGAAVVRDVPAYATAVGVPAAVIKRQEPKR